MLFMVVEKFKRGCTEAIGQRFREKGRMMPEELDYVSSLVQEPEGPDGSRTCFQVMEAPNIDAFKAWTDNWDDLMEFEILPVLPSGEFWERWAGR